MTSNLPFVCSVVAVLLVVSLAAFSIAVCIIGHSWGSFRGCSLWPQQQGVAKWPKNRWTLSCSVWFLDGLWQTGQEWQVWRASWLAWKPHRARTRLLLHSRCTRPHSHSQIHSRSYEQLRQGIKARCD